MLVHFVHKFVLRVSTVGSHKTGGQNAKHIQALKGERAMKIKDYGILRSAVVCSGCEMLWYVGFLPIYRTVFTV